MKYLTSMGRRGPCGVGWESSDGTMEWEECSTLSDEWPTQFSVNMWSCKEVVTHEKWDKSPPIKAKEVVFFLLNWLLTMYLNMLSTIR